VVSDTAGSQAAESRAAWSRVAVVSGGGTGIGYAIAAALAADGLRVVIVGRREKVLAEATDALNLDAPGLVSWRAADLADAAAVEELTAGLAAEFGTIDVLVNNAGGNQPRPTDTLADLAEVWRTTYDQNVISSVLLTHGLVPILRRPGGRIVLIGSMSSRTGGGFPAYGAAKAALNGWVLALSTTLAPEGISANVVLPGYVPGTGLAGGAPMPADLHDKIVSRISVGRPGLPEDAAALTRFLASEEAGFLTGQVIEVNGGTVPPNK
jgi:3-oxoacyl-[acyl-carrier protein] reductase